MSFLDNLLQGISMIPAPVHGVEAQCGAKAGAAKKHAVLALATKLIGIPDATATRHIADAKKFNAGLSKLIDGVVECLNASVWADGR
jgi:hypothetical protein